MLAFREQAFVHLAPTVEPVGGPQGGHDTMVA